MDLNVEYMVADGMSVDACVEVGGDGSCVLEYIDKAGCSVSVEGETPLDFFTPLFTEKVMQHIVT